MAQPVSQVVDEPRAAGALSQPTKSDEIPATSLVPTAAPIPLVATHPAKRRRLDSPSQATADNVPEGATQGRRSGRLALQPRKNLAVRDPLAGLGLDDDDADENVNSTSLLPSHELKSLPPSLPRQPLQALENVNARKSTWGSLKSSKYSMSTKVNLDDDSDDVPLLSSLKTTAIASKGRRSSRLAGQPRKSLAVQDPLAGLFDDSDDTPLVPSDMVKNPREQASVKGLSKKPVSVVVAGKRSEISAPSTSPQLDGDVAEAENDVLNHSGKQAIRRPDTIVVPYDDERGLTRIGPQPMKPQLDIRSVPETIRDFRIKYAVKQAHKLNDSRFRPAELLAQETEDLTTSLLASFEGDPEKPGMFKRRDDYTGRAMWHTTGGFSASIESVYPVVLASGKPAYHCRGNVAMIATFLNILKRRHTPLALALLAVILRCDKVADMEVRKRRMLFGFLGLTNDSILMKAVAFCHLSHVDQAEKWGSWSSEEIAATLQAIRTGIVDPSVEHRLENTLSYGQLQGSGTWNIPLREAHRVCEEIAAKYGIGRQAFRELCMMRSSNDEPEVFFPFWIACRPVVQTSGWSWSTLLRFATYRLQRMRKYCNKHAEEAELGENSMTPELLVFWWCHHVCQKIKSLKDANPTWTTDDIAWNMLDRWGLPVVPWVHHLLNVSLCRLHDHGIAMRFGLENPEDPVNGFDMDKCTITMDSQATNIAMLNYSADDWEPIRAWAKDVPLQHYYWRVDGRIGRSLLGSEVRFDVEPDVPSPDFEMDLIPLDCYVRNNVPIPAPACNDCQVEFKSVAELVCHCKEQHRASPRAISPMSSSKDEQDKLDTLYWETFAVCTECNISFSSEWDYNNHTDRVHDKRFICDICHSRFGRARNLADHLAGAHNIDRPVCEEDGCHKTFGSTRALDKHRNEVHKGVAPPMRTGKERKCDHEGCSEMFRTFQELYKHVNEAHGTQVFRCDQSGCTDVFLSQQDLDKHHEYHGKTRIPCTYSGCDFTYTGKASNLQQHIDAKHLNIKHPCDEPGCDKVYSQRQNLLAHKRAKHPNS